MDWSENHSCIKCDKSGNVLVCSENGCPLTVHEGCLGYPAGLDDAGRFRCPYCLYKQAVVETRKAREYALARKKALLIFMDGSEKGVGENGHDRPDSNGANVSKSKPDNDGVIDQGVVRLSEAEKIGNAPESSAGSKAEDPSVMMNEENGSRAAAEKRIQEEEREASIDSVEEEIQEEQREASVEEEIQEEQRKASVEEEEEIQEEEREASVEKEIPERNVKLLSKKKKRFTRKNAKLLQEEEEIQEEQREASVEEEEEEEEEIQKEECEASVEEEDIHEEKQEASTDEEDIEEEESEASYASNSQDSSFTAKAKRGLKRSKPVEKEPESARVKSKSLKHHDKKKKKQAPPVVSTPTRRSARGSSSAKGTGKALKKELVSPRKSAIPIQISAKPAKRQRLLWTEEEETALREGVTKYSREEKIPWRKILEESKKFNETRTPDDLRHKWKKRNF